MYLFLISIMVGLLVGLGLGLSGTLGYGWSTFHGVLAFGLTQFIAGRVIQKRVKAVMESVQAVLMEGQKRLQAKMARWQMRPPGSIQAMQAEMARDQKVFVTEALSRTEELRRFVMWVPMMKRQIATAQFQLHWMIKDFKKVDELMPKDNFTRNYDNLFPTVSYAGQMGKVQLMLNYSAKTRRPNYANLSSAIRFNNRYIWQSGNAQLQPELTHNISATAVWKFLTFMANYMHTKDPMMTWSSPYNDEGVVLVKPRNIDTPFRMMVVYGMINHTIGVWTMNYTLGIQKQWLTINAPDPRETSGIRVTKFNDKPIGIAQMLNTFRFNGGWQLELGGLMQTKGYSQNIYMKSVYFDLTAAVQKTLLKDNSLVLRLEGRDLARKAHMNVDTDFGSHTIRQTNLMDTQKVKLSVRYTFNTAQSKYRGTGAGADQKARM